MLDKFGNKIYAQRKHEPQKSKQLPLVEPDIVNGKQLLSFSEKMKQSKGDVPF